MHELATRLTAFVTASAAPYGKEYSVRWRNGIADRDRFLMSIHKLAIADSDEKSRQRLQKLLQDLGCPIDSSRQLWDYWSDTRVVHLGFEQASDQPYVKIYFELTSRDQIDVSQEQLVHVAIKWNPLEAGNVALSRYSLVPGQNEDQLARRLRMFCPEQFLPVLERLVDRALNRCDAEDLMLLLVTDDNSPRRSCDLNLYNSGMTIADSLDDLSELAMLNGCQDREWLTGQQGLQLGHLAVGTDRNRHSFVTLYYGIEAH